MPHRVFKRNGKTHPPRPQQNAVTRNGLVLGVTHDLACLQLPIVNLYFYGVPMARDRQWALIDAGTAQSERKILRAAIERFGDSRPSAIILTHGHFDHIGAVANLANLWDVPIYAHELEMPYLTGMSSYPPPDPAVGGGMMSFLARLYPRGPIHLGNRVRPLPADGTIPGMPEWRWIHTPGHTAGHVALFRDMDRTLIAGDAFVTVKQESAVDVMFNQRPHVRRPPAYYTTDWQAARRSVEALARLLPNVAATGHGLPMYGAPMRQQLFELARDWDHLAVPAHGRYTRRPALTDKWGVVSVPPPVTDPQLLIAAGVGLVGILGGLLLRSMASKRPRT